MSVIKSESIEQIAMSLVSETYKLIDGQTAGTAQARRLSVLFLARFAGTMVYRSLTEAKPEGCTTPKQIEKFTLGNFAAVKGQLQEAIAAAFTGAVNTFSGQRVDYYCQVKPIGPAINKEPI